MTNHTVNPQAGRASALEDWLLRNNQLQDGMIDIPNNLQYSARRGRRIVNYSDPTQIRPISQGVFYRKLNVSWNSAQIVTAANSMSLFKFLR